MTLMMFFFLVLLASGSVNCFLLPPPNNPSRQREVCNSRVETSLKGFLPAREILTTQIIRTVLDQLKDSDFIDEKHQEHVESESVTHLFKNTPLAQLPDAYKLQFVNSWAGQALERVMKEEQEYLGDWKIEKIVQAAGDINNAQAARDAIQQHIASAPIVMYSFEDCPWCVAAKTLLEEHYPEVPLLVVELESLQQLGKSVRAELALWTGRTSMPCIVVRGRPIGGYTDGAPYCGPGLQVLHESNQLAQLLRQKADKSTCTTF